MSNGPDSGAPEPSLRAAAGPTERFTEAPRGIVATRALFSTIGEARACEPLFRQAFATQCKLSGPESPAAMAAADNLSDLLGVIDQIEEATALREKVFDYARSHLPADDLQYLNIRENLAWLYRRAGKPERADELYRHAPLCKHLQPAFQFLQESGAKLCSIGKPWSDNCHLWAYFDAVLDCEGLMERLGLDACVHIHDHRGTHDGSERGLVCTIHNDGIMGLHG